jgi:IS30 family transposase
VTTLDELPASLRQTLTWDQGTEMARHLEITATLGLRVYFCDAASPWQRGSNENTNGLLRQYFPKSTDLTVHTTSRGSRTSSTTDATHPRRPTANRALQRTANVRVHPDVAMTAGNQAVAMASFRASSTIV